MTRPDNVEVTLTWAWSREPGGVAVWLSADLEGRTLVGAGLTVDGIARLFAGEQLRVPAFVDPEALAGMVEEPEPKPKPEPEPEPEPEVEVEPAAREYSSRLDEPPPGSTPITATADPGEAVVAYVHRRWRDATLIRRDRATAVVEYTQPDFSHPAQTRVDLNRVRYTGGGTQSGR